MSTANYFVTPEGLQEAPPQPTPNLLLKAVAMVVSYLMHPIFIPMYVLTLLLFVEPFLFLGATPREKALTFGRAFVNYTFFPLISILLLRGLKLIPSIHLKERKDRIIPFIISNIWYFWIWFVWRGLNGVPEYLIVFALSIFLASSIGLLANIYIKISMHGIALGTAVTYLLLLTLLPDAPNLTRYLAIAILAAGITGTARLLLGAHTPKEYYIGLAVGALAVLMADFIV